MSPGEYQVRRELPSELLGIQSDEAIGIPDLLDAPSLEALMLNLDASLRVHGRAHFFNWTQGLLQSLITHEVLICAVCDGKSSVFRVDSFSTRASNPAIFGELLLRDPSVVPTLVGAWTKRRFRPVVIEVDRGSALAGGAFARELEQQGATQLLVHGVHDLSGQAASLFTFACAPGAAASHQAYLSQLAVPFLHTAWLRTQISADANAVGLKPTAATNITPREQEILKWICLGKSNFEIGAILDISALTVKNHVQKILRKLNVANRAQAVGKALELRILSP